LADLGRATNEKVAGGVNVERITPAADGSLHMEVYERGVGITLACGTGACAAAAAAAEWGIAGPEVVVRMPGGAATIEVGDAVRYSTWVTHVADIELPWP
jgi:diaminopimelate epimerase